MKDFRVPGGPGKIILMVLGVILEALGVIFEGLRRLGAPKRLRGVTRGVSPVPLFLKATKCLVRWVGRLGLLVWVK